MGNLNVNAVKAIESHACGCIGPQNGEPLCPCRMRGVSVKNGRYVEVIDHGPVAETADTDWQKLRATVVAMGS